MEEFGFPFEPYEIQVQLASKIYEALSNHSSESGLDRRKIGVFESPTGTGKTMSIICSCMKRISEDRMSEEEIIESSSESDDDGPNWVQEAHSSVRKKDVQSRKRRSEEKRKRFFERKKKRIDLKFESDSDEDGSRTVLIYSSRTHSQLSQFVSELKKTKYSNFYLISLASRSHLCINDRVRRATDIDEACEDARKGKSCRYYGDKVIDNWDLLRRDMLSMPMDIEDLVRKGKEHDACPYYCARSCVPIADVLVLPYSSIVQKAVRSSLNIPDLSNCYVVFDEAHNLLEAVPNINSVTVSIPSLLEAGFALDKYVEKYGKRMNPDGLRHVMQLKEQVLDSLLVWTRGRSDEIQSFTVDSFLDSWGVPSHLNLLKFDSPIFIDMRLCDKIMGFCEEYSKLHPDFKFRTGSGLRGLRRLLLALGSELGDAAVFASKTSIKFVQLNASRHFQPFWEDTKSLVLVGGTIKPFDDFIFTLMPSLYNNMDKAISTFSCSHVASKSQVLCFGVESFRDSVFDFSFSSREDNGMIHNLALVINIIYSSSPGGMVVFFSSYVYLDYVLKVLNKKKFLFMENAFFEQQGSPITLLTDFRNVIDSSSKAVLFCVVGGKLSEGINFEDEYCRSVVVVGIPYPDTRNKEVATKLDYLKKQGYDSRRWAVGKCMRGVNQSIGRCIRHRKDYACMILIDGRYRQNFFSDHLPSWVGFQGMFDGTRIKHTLIDFFDSHTT